MVEGDIFPVLVECYDVSRLDDDPLEQRLVYTEEESQQARKEFAEKYPGCFLVNVPPY